MPEPTAWLYLDALPPHTNKGTIVRLLEQAGGIDRLKIGAIAQRGRTATVEVPEGWLSRLIKALDGSAVGNQYIRARSAAVANTARGATAADSQEHFARLARLLTWEAAAESEQMLRAQRRRDGLTAEATGTSLVDLVLRDECPGLGDRVLVLFGKRDLTRQLPWNRLGIGTPVLVSEQNSSGDTGWRGIVCDRHDRTIQVALTHRLEPDSDRPLFRLDQSSDEVARERQRAALERAAAASGDRLAQLRDVLLGVRPPRFAPERPWEPLHPAINDAQRRAIGFALSAQDVAVLHGPPGTGKTTTVVELIRQAVQRGEKVLACAPSNLAVDNMFERLLAAGERVVRLGHPARVLPELREHTLDLVVERHPDVKLSRKLVREAQALRNSADKYTRAKPLPGAKQEMRAEARQLLADARRIESLAIREILDRAQVLCATTTGIDSEILGQRTFDLAVIDEACQSTEPGCWIPLLRSDRVVLAGDHQQLPPTVVSAEADREGFSVSLLERLMQLDPAGLSRQLLVQYRMHEQIMAFPAGEFYDDSLLADESVRRHRLCELPGVTENDWTRGPVTYFDTAGASYDEEREPDGESRWNPQEAEIVCHCAEQLLSSGLSPQQLAVIAPYSAQVRHLRQRLPIAGLEVDTVDGFQGREKEAIVISLVRSNSDGEIGFLADVRRMNVALTRARRKLIIVGDSATIANHPFYVRLLQYLEEIGGYRTVWEIA